MQLIENVWLRSQREVPKTSSGRGLNDSKAAF